MTKENQMTKGLVFKYENYIAINTSIILIIYKFQDDVPCFGDEENSNDLKSTSGDRKDKDKKEKNKLVTRDPHLLLSFVYFDTSHCGYIFEKDIEELLYTLGLNLSRAQVRKLVSKVVTRETFHYR